ncbi:MAG: hypothetical protein DYG89_19010 [Caldilinea sp. CFX5]|nr:hypothetical protein [Caldilinea sp. CFX5]
MLFAFSQQVRSAFRIPPLQRGWKTLLTVRGCPAKGARTYFRAENDAASDQLRAKIGGDAYQPFLPLADGRCIGTLFPGA